MDNEMTTTQPKSLIARTAARFGVDADKLMATLKKTAFSEEVTNEQMMALLIVAEQYKLNPFTREIFAFPQKGGIVPVVSVDGWARIMNSHPAFQGMEFRYPEGSWDWIECAISRADRARPVVVREFMDECIRNTQPWTTHPRRMLRHKAMIQCARLAFGFAGIFDHDEAQNIIEGELENAEPTTTQKLNQTLQASHQEIEGQKAPAAPKEETYPQETMIDGERTWVDSNAELFNPEQHSMGPDDIPTVRKDGSFRKRRAPAVDEIVAAPNDGDIMNIADEDPDAWVSDKGLP